MTGTREYLQALMDEPLCRARTLKRADLTLAPPAARARRTPVPRGHAAPPGSGPEGESCRSCAHLWRRGDCSRTYLKCALMRAHWTGGGATDVRAGDAACRRWEARS